ncbi:MAG: sugar-binding domain-containing protein [Veillonellaceae bacterium]|nr:sugar-binding domain-containing protein [Veillonellaceae bacterium]
MDSLALAYSRLVPELMEVAEERYRILRHIAHAEPIGRRLLATQLNLTERVTRSHVDHMRDTGLLAVTGEGMVLTQLGKEFLPELTRSMNELAQINVQQDFIKKALGIEDVIIISSRYGNADLAELGYGASREVMQVLQPDQTLVVTGGSTMAKLAEMLPKKNLNTLVLPARGGVGERVEYQSNVIASVIASKLGGTYKMLHFPDGLSKETIELLIDREPQIKEVNQQTKRADVLLFGIGQAVVMAKKRNSSQEVCQQIEKAGGVGEALGCYCDINGHIVYEMTNIGLSLRTVSDIPHVFAVAGGAEKGAAIIGAMRACHKGTLIIDEAAAKAILSLLK